MTKPRVPLLVLCTFLASAGIGHVVSGRLTRPTPDQALALYTREQYAAATHVVEGELRAETVPVLREYVAANGTGAVLVIMRADDIRQCEDLGRQIRALRRATQAHVPMVAIADAADTSLVRDFLRIQRIANISIVPVAPSALLSDNDQLPTPAVLILDAQGATVSGVAHPVRFPNARFRSFAEELRDALEELGSHAVTASSTALIAPGLTAAVPTK